MPSHVSLTYLSEKLRKHFYEAHKHCYNIKSKKTPDALKKAVRVLNFMINEHSERLADLTEERAYFFKHARIVIDSFQGQKNTEYIEAHFQGLNLAIDAITATLERN